MWRYTAVICALVLALFAIGLWDAWAAIALIVFVIIMIMFFGR